MKSISSHYFAAANTSEGFVSYYDTIFDVLDELYIIKGGSGTGKSRLIKEIGIEAEKREAEIAYFHCSFDPDSLDGIMINNRTAIIDGTAPHVYEPKLPGATDNILDLGRFWNAEMLANRRKELISLFEEKSAYFHHAYTYLSAFGRLTETSGSISQKYLNRDNIRDSIEKMCNLDSCPDAVPLIRLCSAFGRKGTVEFSSYKDSAEKIITVSDEKNTHLMSEFFAALQNGKVKIKSYSPYKKMAVNSILLTNGTAIVPTQANGDIDLSEFCSGGLKNEYAALSDNAHICGSILSHAAERLQRAADAHDDIEKIYISAMDFEEKERFSREFIQNLKY